MTGKWRNLGEGLAGLAIMAFSLLTPFLNPRRRRWGASQDELRRRYPGDDLVPLPKGDYLHAVTINAPAAVVWPWLVQLGQGRGGFYSYELLENLAGCKMKNADAIIPKLQRLEIGDSIPMHPAMGSPYRVAAIEPERALVLRIRLNSLTGDFLEPEADLPEKYQNMSWLFMLTERDDGTTRLVSRSRNDWDDSRGNNIFYSVFGPLSIEMDRKMLLGIKRRAEGRA